MCMKRNLLDIVQSNKRNVYVPSNTITMLCQLNYAQVRAPASGKVCMSYRTRECIAWITSNCICAHFALHHKRTHWPSVYSILRIYFSFSSILFHQLCQRQILDGFQVPSLNFRPIDCGYRAAPLMQSVSIPILIVASLAGGAATRFCISLFLFALSRIQLRTATCDNNNNSNISDKSSQHLHGRNDRMPHKKEKKNDELKSKSCCMYFVVKPFHLLVSLLASAKHERKK